MESNRKKNREIICGAAALLLVGQAFFFTIGASKETLQVGGVAGRYGWHTQPLWLMTFLLILEILILFRMSIGECRIQEN